MTTDDTPAPAEDGARTEPAHPGAARTFRRTASPDAEPRSDCDYCEPRVLCALCGARLCD